MALGDQGGWQSVAGGELRRRAVFLFLGATADDQLGGDLGTRSERADADIATGEFLRDDAHRLLAESEAAIAFRDLEAEHAQLGHLPHPPHQHLPLAPSPLLRLLPD